MTTILIRHGEPSKYDHAEYGTLCKCMIHPTDRFNLYRQTSKDESNPDWKLIGNFGPDDDISEFPF